MAFLLGFTRPELAKIFEATGRTVPSPKQLHYWPTVGLIDVDMLTAKTPVYSFQAVLDMALIVELLNYGVTLDSVRTLMGRLKEKHGWAKPGSSLEHVRFLTDGVDRFEYFRSESTMDDIDYMIKLLNGRTTWTGFSIDLEDLVTGILEAIQKLGWLDRLRPDEQPYKRLLGNTP